MPTEQHNVVTASQNVASLHAEQLCYSVGSSLCNVVNGTRKAVHGNVVQRCGICSTLPNVIQRCAMLSHRCQTLSNVVTKLCVVVSKLCNVSSCTTLPLSNAVQRCYNAVQRCRNVAKRYTTLCNAYFLVFCSHLCNISIITAKSLMTELHNIVLWMSYIYD